MKAKDTELNMTPMVDVTFLLLIFFMITASFVMQRSLTMPDPSPSAAGPAPVDPQEPDVIVEVDAFNTFHVLTLDWEREAPSKHDLLIALEDARQGDSTGRLPTTLLVRAHEEALHEKVVAALDAGALAGMEEISLAAVE